MMREAQGFSISDAAGAPARNNRAHYLLCGLFALAVASPALARDLLGQYDPNSERSKWFNSLVVPQNAPFGGRLCCDTSDGFAVDAEQRGDQWYAKWKDDWVVVPANIVLKTVSIDEKAYLFVYQGQKRCFVPPLNGS